MYSFLLWIALTGFAHPFHFEIVLENTCAEVYVYKSYG